MMPLRFYCLLPSGQDDVKTENPQATALQVDFMTFIVQSRLQCPFALRVISDKCVAVVLKVMDHKTLVKGR